MPDAPRIPTTLGRYNVLRLLGSGAMGSVYLAEDPRLKRKVALKVIRPEAATSQEDRSEILARFEREAEVSSLLNDPGVVTVYELGDSEEGPFLAMEYVEGSSLEGLIRSGASAKVSLGQKLALLETVALALDHAHREGVVHRDVKPANIMLTPDLRAKLMDFGIAHRQDAHLTRTGTFLGTPTYASPEQIREAGVDGRSDLFSLAVVAFELLSGQVPFPGSSINTILFRIVNEPPVEVPAVEGILPEAWRRVFQKGLAKDPGQRHESCGAFVADLRRAASGSDLQDLGHLTLRAGTLPEIQTARTGPARGSRGPWVAGLGLAVIALGAGLAFWPRNRTVEVRSLPAGARVHSEGRELGRTPLVVRLAAGKRLELALPGHDAATLAIPGTGSPGVVVLQERVSRETLQSEPSGAQVVLDGRTLEGRTPLEVEWHQGRSHALTFTLPGTDRVLARDFAPGQVPGREVFTLGEGADAVAPDAPGRIRVQGAFAVRVKVGGESRGEQRPPFTLTLPPGMHVVELSAPKVFFHRTETVTVKPGQSEVLALPPVVQVVVDTHPTDGPVLVDGQPTGVSSDGNTPIAVAAGPHVISIQGRPTREKVDLRKDMKVRFRY